MANNPLLKHMPNHSLTRRPYDQRILQLSLRIDNQSIPIRIGSQSMMRHHRTLLGKSIDVLRLLTQKALGNQQRKVGIFGTVFSDAVIEVSADLIPEGHAPWFDDHAAAYRGCFG